MEEQEAVFHSRNSGSGSASASASAYIISQTIFLCLNRTHMSMSDNEDHADYTDNNSSAKRRFRDRSKEVLSKQAVKLAKQAEEHERFINKVGLFCLISDSRDSFFGGSWLWLVLLHLWGKATSRSLGILLVLCRVCSSPLDILQDFCYYANTIFLVYLLFYPKNEKLFLVCFSFAELLQGPLAWALIVWRCSLVFSSVDKIVSVLIHLLPGLVFFTIRWWNPATFEAMRPAGMAGRSTWPYIEDKSYLWMWLFLVPLAVYILWQVLYFLIVNVLRQQRFLRDPEVMTSYRELSKKAQKANNIWWRLSGLLGDQNRLLMYIVLQGIFTVATTALTVPIFLSYELSVVFQLLKISASVWNGGSFLIDVMPRQVILKEKKKSEMQPVQNQKDQ
ncbi:putative membrane protein [Glycine soja]